jgi:hypothetical protein
MIDVILLYIFCIVNLHIFYREIDKRLADSKHYNKENLQEKREKIFSLLFKFLQPQGSFEWLTKLAPYTFF